MVEVRREFVGEESQVAAVRGFIQEVLDRGHPASYEVTLLASELASNAIRHTTSGAGGRFVVGVRRDPTAIRVEVRDQGCPTRPRLPWVARQEKWHGLSLVEMLSDDWGIDGDPHGHTVWFVRSLGPR